MILIKYLLKKTTQELHPKQKAYLFSWERNIKKVSVFASGIFGPLPLIKS